MSQPIFVNPVPAGTNLPTITFSFRPSSVSTFPLIEASVNTLVVSWNEAAYTNESVDSAAFVIPSSILSNFAGFLPEASRFALIVLISPS